MVVTPGFIDVHTHDDFAVLSNPEMLPKISQGVTTVVAGNCGISLAPFHGEGPLVAPMHLLGGEGAYRYPSVSAFREEFAR